MSQQLPDPSRSHPPVCPKAGVPDKFCPACQYAVEKGLSLSFTHALLYAGTRR